MKLPRHTYKKDVTYLVECYLFGLEFDLLRFDVKNKMQGDIYEKVSTVTTALRHNTQDQL